MVQLTIDGQLCEGGRIEGALGRYDDAQLTHPFLRREGERVEVLLEDTRQNRTIIGNPDEAIEAEGFNGKQHTATLEVEGVPFITGYARLKEFSHREGFRVEIHAPGASWTVSAALGMLHAAGIDWQGRFDFQQIGQSWEEGAAVCFLPVFREGFEPLHPSGYTEVERILPANDYHPFLRLYDLVQAIFCRAGYKLVSEFFESAFFRSLYMSGAYASTDTSALRKRYGFFVRRKGDVSATANSSGRVYTSQPPHASSTGPIVNAFTPSETDSSGHPMSDIYNNGGVLVVENGEPIFKPRNRVKASFHFHLEYTTDYRILSRSRLKGFDTFYLGEGITLRGQLNNIFVDKRDQTLASHSYTVMVFDASSGDAYRVVDSRGTVMASFTGRSGNMLTPSNWTHSQLTLQLQTSNGWVSSALDWALYNGSIGERGTKRVEIDCFTPVMEVTPNGRHFHSVYFAGADEGMQLTLHEGTTLGVDFSQKPGFGSLIHFDDIARHPIRQSVLIEALIHLFNLRVYTDTEALEICVEPEAQFYDRSHIVDWSDRIDPAQPIIRRDRALEERESRLYRYAGSVDGDDVDGDNGDNGDDTTGTPYAAWRISTQNFATQDGCQKRVNPLFGAVKERSGFRINAPSAVVIAPEGTDAEENFTPCIVSFQGLQPLPEGEVWGWPAPEGLYPAARFSETADGTSLCFDGTQTAEGLRRFHNHEEERRSFAQQVSLTLKLYPEEVALLRHRARGDIAGCNSIFRLKAASSGDLYLLRRVERYDPETHTARCVFENAL